MEKKFQMNETLDVKMQGTVRVREGGHGKNSVKRWGVVVQDVGQPFPIKKKWWEHGASGRAPNSRLEKGKTAPEGCLGNRGQIFTTPTASVLVVANVAGLWKSNSVEVEKECLNITGAREHIDRQNGEELETFGSGGEGETRQSLIQTWGENKKGGGKQRRKKEKLRTVND